MLPELFFFLFLNLQSPLIQEEKIKAACPNTELSIPLMAILYFGLQGISCWGSTTSRSIEYCGNLLMTFRCFSAPLLRGGKNQWGIASAACLLPQTLPCAHQTAEQLTEVHGWPKPRRTLNIIICKHPGSLSGTESSTMVACFPLSQ